MTEQEIKRVLFGAKVLLGKEGKNWVKGRPGARGQNSNNRCIMTAIADSNYKLGYDFDVEYATATYLRTVLKDLGYEYPSLVMFNDNSMTTFENVNELFDTAINRIKPVIGAKGETAN
jgi:hypothetical protein